MQSPKIQSLGHENVILGLHLYFCFAMNTLFDNFQVRYMRMRIQHRRISSADAQLWRRIPYNECINKKEKYYIYIQSC